MPGIHPLSSNPLESRADLQRAVRNLFDPLLPFFSAAGATVRLGATGSLCDRVTAGLEGFARPLWGLAPLTAGGAKFGHWALYRRGLAAGTDPDHSEYWGTPTDFDQRLVEMAAVGFALSLVPDLLWDPLPQESRDTVASYLAAAFGREYIENNWKFFRVLIALGLDRCGVETDPAPRRAYLDQLDGFYLGDGWYRDGPVRRADHYIPFAFHYYGLLYAALSDDPERAALYRKRAAVFAQEARHWYAEDGAALPFGRSLTYRFAHAGFWGALAFAGVEALSWGRIKGYYLRNLRWWAGRPIFDRDGVLSVGFGYPNLLMSESYNSPGSPYWAMKAFLPLALPETHPFWTAVEEPAETPPAPVPLRQPGMVALHQPGHVVALSSGQEHGRMRGAAEKYAKFAYSTRYGFSIEADDRHFAAAAFDSMLGLSDDGVHFRMRETNEAALIAGDRLYALWRPYADVEVETWLVPAGNWHLRLHRVTTPRRLQVTEGGFAIEKPDFRAWTEDVEDARAVVRTGRDTSAIIGFDARRGRVISPIANTNVMVEKTLLPQLAGSLEPGSHVLACAVLALPDGAAPDAALATLPTLPRLEDLEAGFAASGRPTGVFDLGRDGRTAS